MSDVKINGLPWDEYQRSHNISDGDPVVTYPEPKSLVYSEFLPIPDKKTVFFPEGKSEFHDVDKTLLIFYRPYMKIDKPTVEPIAEREGLLVFPHVVHIDMLKEHAYRGHIVFVWSAGGPVWARSVVEKLDIGKYVDAVIPKPDWFYDDHTVDHFMPEINRIWKDPL